VTLAIAAFWVSASLMIYIYVGYPLLARVAARFSARDVAKGKIHPTVTVVVTVYNEAKGIAAKLENLLALEYPRELLQVLVASDASSDQTDDIVRSYATRGVSLLRVEGRVGKTACQNAAVVAASGEIIVFTDATTQIDRTSINEMVGCFADPSVGCVAGRLIYVDAHESATGSGGTAYWEYELSLRQAESRIGSLVGVSGCLYAVRKSAYRPISPDLISDFVIATVMRRQGLRTVLEIRGICREETLTKARQELSMRVRVAIRSITALVRERDVLNPLRHGAFAWQLWSHKVLRYASPLIWAGLLVASFALSANLFYRLALAAQLLLIAAGVIGWLTHARGAMVLVKPYYFLLTNVASLMALARYLRGERVVIWKTVR